MERRIYGSIEVIKGQRKYLERKNNDPGKKT